MSVLHIKPFFLLVDFGAAKSVCLACPASTERDILPNTQQPVVTGASLRFYLGYIALSYRGTHFAYDRLRLTTPRAGGRVCGMPVGVVCRTPV